MHFEPRHIVYIRYSTRLLIFPNTISTDKVEYSPPQPETSLRFEVEGGSIPINEQRKRLCNIAECQNRVFSVTKR